VRNEDREKENKVWEMKIEGKKVKSARSQVREIERKERKSLRN